MRLRSLLMTACVGTAFAAAPAVATAAGGTGLTGGAGSSSGSSGSTGATGAPGAPGTTTGTTGATGATGASGTTDGGVPIGGSTAAIHPTVPGETAAIIDGVGFAPAAAPAAVKRAIWAGDQIDTMPYVWGGGHASFTSDGYDCSGSVSYVLHAAGLLSSPEDSSQLEGWGVKGAGHWITVYTNPTHAFIEIAGIRFDTSAEDDPDPPPGTGPRWRPLMTGAPGFQARHPPSF